MAADLRNAREDAGISLRRLASAAGVSHSTLLALERDAYDPSTEVLSRIGFALGLDLSMRFYPGTGPLLRDHLQAAMIEVLLEMLHPRWRPTPEVTLTRPVRGVIDLVLESPEPPLISCEAHSDLRRLEQQIRWSRTKSDALAASRGQPVSRLLLLRSTRLMRALVAEYASTFAAAYPGSTRQAYAALAGEAPWPGDTVLWCRVERGQARVLADPPRHVTVGR